MYLSVLNIYLWAKIYNFNNEHTLASIKKERKMQWKENQNVKARFDQIKYLIFYCNVSLKTKCTTKNVPQKP